MKKKIINIVLAIALSGLYIISYQKSDIDNTIDALTGATPENSLIDTIVGATNGLDDGDDDDHEDDD